MDTKHPFFWLLVALLTLVLGALLGYQTVQGQPERLPYHAFTGGVATTTSAVPLGSPSAGDQVPISDSATAVTWRALIDCPDTGGNHYNYTLATNSWSCGTSTPSTVAPTTSQFVTTLADAALSAEVVRQWLGNYYTETYPASPTAYDDEFDDTSGNSGTVNGLNARWTWRNQSTATATFGTQGWLTLGIPASASPAWRIIEQTMPVGNWTVEAKFSFAGNAADSAQGGIIAIDGVNGDFYYWGVVLNAVITTNPSIVTMSQEWTNVTNYAGNKMINTLWGANTVYLRLQYISSTTTYDCFFSSDGIGWVRVVSFVDVRGTTKFGIGLSESNNTGTSKLHVDYFRKVA